MAGGLYAIVDPDALGAKDPERFTQALLEGGCARLQLRSKTAPDRAYLALARRIAARCAAAQVPFVVNDRADVARIVEADGLHLGQDDLPPTDARAVVGRGVEIGLSTHDEAQAAAGEGADLIAFGPVFPTASKERPDPVVGVERLAAVCRASSRPVIAIGGLDVERATEAREAGASFGAVIGALARADDPARLARALHEALGGVA